MAFISIFSSVGNIIALKIIYWYLKKGFSQSHMLLIVMCAISIIKACVHVVCMWGY